MPGGCIMLFLQSGVLVAADAPIERFPSRSGRTRQWGRGLQLAQEHARAFEDKAGGEELWRPRSLGGGDGSDSEVHPPAKTVRL